MRKFKSRLLYVVLFAPLLFLAGCPDPSDILDVDVYVRNNSSYEVRYFYVDDGANELSSDLAIGQEKFIGTFECGFDYYWAAYSVTNSPVDSDWVTIDCSDSDKVIIIDDFY